MKHGAEAALSRLHERAAAGDARALIETVAARRVRPVTVEVSGRPGVGKSTILAVLRAAELDAGGLGVRLKEVGAAPRGSSLTHTSASEQDVDVLVYVIAGAVSPVDCAVLGRVPVDVMDGVVIVLTKADSLDNPTEAAASAADRLGRPVLPVMGSMAAGSANAGTGRAPFSVADVRAVAAADLSKTDLMGVDRFLTADLPLSTRRREDLLDHIELRGLAVVVEMLRRRPAATEDELLGALSDISGASALIAAVASEISTATSSRDIELHRSLRDASAQHRQVRGAVEAYLASDEATAAQMRYSAIRSAVSIDIESEAAAREQAVYWKERAVASSDTEVRRAALALCRGYLRMLPR